LSFLAKTNGKYWKKALFEGKWAAAVQSLFRERLLKYTGDLSSATCYDCWIELARVVDDPPKSYTLRDEQILQLCPECGPIVAPAYIRKTYQPAAEQLITQLMIGVGLMPQSVRVIQPGVVWRLGSTQPRPGQLQAWWVRIGMAIKGALGDAGWPLFEAWSASSQKHEPKTTAKAWRSFAPQRIAAGRRRHHTRHWRLPVARPAPRTARSPALHPG
jgi:hypothetical protein